MVGCTHPSILSLLQDFQLPVSSGLMELLEKEEIFSGQELPCRRCYEEKALNNGNGFAIILQCNVKHKILLTSGFF